VVFDRNFNELKDDDQKEILNLVAFKRTMTEQQGEMSFER
jgi:hypothetical protein